MKKCISVNQDTYDNLVSLSKNKKDSFDSIISKLIAGSPEGVSK